MRLALRLAARARGRTSPNPMVGALVVRGGRIVGKGYHHQAGMPHAEVNALADAGEAAQGADLYLNLEPCSHYGRTPPCVDSIIASKVKRVFVGMGDPNPLVSGRGISKLRQSGLEVAVGVLEKECRKLNEIFIKYITTGRPFVILKSAVSLDGRIAAETGDSKWISNEQSRVCVHRLRDQVDAILVGVGTVLKDDPQLTTRLPHRRGKDPIRIVVDSTLKIPLDARILTVQSDARTIIATTRDAAPEKIHTLEARGAHVLVVPSQKTVDLDLLMEALGKQEITSVLIEGGSRVNTTALESGIVDKLVFFYAPRIIGGARAPLVVKGKGVSSVDDAVQVYRITVRKIGDDVMVEGYLHQDRDRLE